MLLNIASYWEPEIRHTLLKRLSITQSPDRSCQSVSVTDLIVTSDCMAVTDNTDEEILRLPKG